MPLSNPKPRSTKKRYDAPAFQTRLRELLDKNHESARGASLQADLDVMAIQRYMGGRRPDRSACIALADHFGINPNELLQLAGYTPMKLFQIETASAQHLPPEAVDVALDIARIEEPRLRREVAQAVRTLLKKYFTA